MKNLSELFPEIDLLDAEITKVQNPGVLMLVAKFKATLDNSELSINLTHDKFLHALQLYDAISTQGASVLLSEEKRAAFFEVANATLVELLQHQ